jgi:hypothetical protein
VLAYERAAGDDRRRVWINFGPRAVPLPEGWHAQLRTDAADGPLAVDGAIVMT